MQTTENLPIAPMTGVRTRFPVATTIALLTWAVCTALYHLGAVLVLVSRSRS
jgi:hypothetical protein